MAERFEIVEKALLKLLEEKKYATLRDILTTMNPMDVAGLFDGLDEKQIPPHVPFASKGTGGGDVCGNGAGGQRASHPGLLRQRAEGSSGRAVRGRRGRHR